MPQTFTAEEFEAYRRRLEEEGPAASPLGSPLPPPPAPTRDYALEPPSFTEFGGNVLQSGVKLGTDILGMAAHPIETIKGIGGVAAGAVEKATGAPSVGPGGPPELLASLEQGKAEREAPFDALVEHMKARYGSVEAASRTAYEDPMGFAADLSGILSIGGAALRAPSAAIRAGGLSRTGTAARVAGLSGRAGQILRGSAQMMDPIQLAAKAGTFGANRALWLLETALTEGAGITTGVRGGPLKAALGFQGGAGASAELTAAMRGKISGMDVLNSAKSAIARLREQRGMSYRAKLAELPKKMQLNLDPIKAALADQMRQYGIFWSRAPARKVKGPAGKLVSQQQPLKLNFSRSTISSAADQTKVRRLINDVNDWGSQPADLTPLGVDTLRRRLDDFYSESGQARAMTTSIADETRRVLDDVPGYTEMTKEYSDLSGMIKEIESELALGGRKASGASLRKLMTVFSDNSGYRQQMLEVLDQFVVDNLGQQISGLNLTSIAPQGLVGRSLATGAVAGGIVFNPQLALFAAMSSPRLMGELMVVLSKVKKGARAIRDVGTLPVSVLAEPAVFRPAAYASELPPPPSIPPGSPDGQ